MYTDVPLGARKLTPFSFPRVTKLEQDSESILADCPD